MTQNSEWRLADKFGTNGLWEQVGAALQVRVVVMQSAVGVESSKQASNDLYSSVLKTTNCHFKNLTNPLCLFGYQAVP